VILLLHSCNFAENNIIHGGSIMKALFFLEFTKKKSYLGICDNSEGTLFSEFGTTGIL